jgi:hypothetical protein
MLPAWLQYLQAWAAVLIALIGAWIAWQQFKIARTKVAGEGVAADRLFGERIGEGFLLATGEIVLALH